MRRRGTENDTVTDAVLYSQPRDQEVRTDMKHTEVRYTGIGFAEALTLLFIALKICKVIDWPWLWVLSPILLTLVFLIVVAVLVVIVTAINNKKH